MESVLPTPGVGTGTSHQADTSSTSGVSKQYDFIVIGGGTSGLVIANRLTENPEVTVLVVEAGENRKEDPQILTPALASSLYDNPTYDWGFLSVPQV